MYDLQWFEFMKFRENPVTGKYKVVVYGFGQWYCHVMDWRGCNFWHGRLPESPVFENERAAWNWLREQVKAGRFNRSESLPGHHAGGDFGCQQGCDDRELGTAHFNKGRTDVEVWRTERRLRLALGLKTEKVA